MELLEASRAQRYTLSEAADLLREPVERVSLELVKRWPQADPQLVTILLSWMLRISMRRGNESRAKLGAGSPAQ